MFQSHVNTNRAMKRLVFLVEHGPKEQPDTFVHILMSIFKFCSFHIILVTEYYNNHFLKFHFYNSKSITSIENIKVL